MRVTRSVTWGFMVIRVPEHGDALTARCLRIFSRLPERIILATGAKSNQSWVEQQPPSEIRKSARALPSDSG